MKHCKACGASLEPDENFCSECGTDNRSDSLTTSESSGTSARKESELRLEKREENETGKFENEVAAAIKRSFPNAVVRQRLQLASKDATEIRTDLFVINRTGIFLVECKNYLGRIRGSMAYDYGQGELWTCQSPSGKIIEIPTRGKNPAQEALDNVSVVREVASATKLRRETFQIHSVLVFPDGADLSGIVGLTVSPAKPLPDHTVVAALTLPELDPYIANADGDINEERALTLIDRLPIATEILSETRADVAVVELKPDEPFERSFPDEDGRNQDAVRGVPKLKEGIKPLHIIGGAIALGVILLVAFAPQFMRLFSFSLLSNSSLLSQNQKGEPPTPSAGPSSIEGTTPTLGPQITSSTFPLDETKRMAPTEQATDVLMPQGPVVETKQAPQTSEPQKPSTPASTAKKSEALVVRPGQPSTSEGLNARTEKLTRNKETQIPRRPAEPGQYETIKTTAARTASSDSAEIVDQLNPGIRLNVTGSQGDWLVVYSKSRQKTVYVKRDDAMLVSVRSPGGESYQEAQVRWKKVEADITESFAKWGVSGATASFREDTAYLEGQVKTDYERFRAEMAAKSIPEVQQIINRIRLNP